MIDYLRGIVFTCFRWLRWNTPLGLWILVRRRQVLGGRNSCCRCASPLCLKRRFLPGRVEGWRACVDIYWECLKCSTGEFKRL